MFTRLCAVFLVGCTLPEPVELTSTTPSVEPVDLRRDFPAPPATGVQWITPSYVIEPHTEAQWCWFSRYDGETSGLVAQWTYQSPGGHHVVLNATNADEDLYADDVAFDCTDPGAMPMTDLEPLMVGGVGDPDAEGGPQGEMLLPPGMAVELEQGTRIALQSHYINTTSDPILVQDALTVDLVPDEEVEVWAAPFVHVETDLDVPRGTSELSFDCTWGGDYNLLFLAGHMHEWGTAFSTVATSGSSTETLYDIPVWDPYFRDAAPVNEYAPGERTVSAGEVYTTNCAWDNDTDHVLSFPEEMCVTFGMAYPTKVPLVCDPD